MNQEKITGTIKFIANDRGFGFLEGDDGQDYYFNTIELRGHISPNDRVSFVPIQAQKGPKGIKIEPLFSGDDYNR